MISSLNHSAMGAAIVRQMERQISVRIHAVLSEPLLVTLLVAKDPVLLHANNEYADQTVQMRKLI